MSCLAAAVRNPINVDIGDSTSIHSNIHSGRALFRRKGGHRVIATYARDGCLQGRLRATLNQRKARRPKPSGCRRSSACRLTSHSFQDTTLASPAHEVRRPAAPFPLPGAPRCRCACSRRVPAACRLQVRTSEAAVPAPTHLSFRVRHVSHPTRPKAAARIKSGRGFSYKRTATPGVPMLLVGWGPRQSRASAYGANAPVTVQRFMDDGVRSVCRAHTALTFAPWRARKFHRVGRGRHRRGKTSVAVALTFNERIRSAQ